MTRNYHPRRTQRTWAQAMALAARLNMTLGELEARLRARGER